MKLAILTTGRQDWGILSSTYRLLKPDVIRWSNPGGHVVRQCTESMESIGNQLERSKPDALMLVGDRYETLSAALSATVLKIPLIHLHGGEVTEGAFDNQLRGAITKLSHLHLVSSEQHRRNVIRMGEDPDTVHVVGAPGTDNAFRTDLLPRHRLAKLIGHPLRPPVHLYIVHPETLSRVDVVEQAILHQREHEPVCPSPLAIMPNQDPGSVEVRRRMQAAFPCWLEALSEVEYWSLLKHTDLLVGNSSSLVVEAPALGIKTKLLGDRQQGRTPPMPADGQCARRIAEVLASWSPPNPPRKRPTPLAG